MPRFSIHSWNDDGSVNEPWMYPEITPYIRELIKVRYRLIPYLYDLLWRAHSEYSPILRPTFHDFPEDERCYLENDDMLLGPNLLVAAVVEPGRRDRTVYLPSGSGWYDFWNGDFYQGGQEVRLSAPWDRPPLLAREGCAIPLNVAEQHFSRPADERAFCMFPYRGPGRFEAECFDDDGESQAYRHGHFRIWRLGLTSSPSTLEIEVGHTGTADPTQGAQIRLLLPCQETRRVQVRAGSLVHDGFATLHRELTVALRS